MKTFRKILLLLFLSTTAAFAQYGNPYGNYGGYGGGYRGGYRSGMPGGGETKPSPEKIEKEKNEQIDKAMARLKEDLNLDDLQFIAIKNEIMSSYKSLDILMKSEIPDEDKTKQYKAIQEKAEKNIMSYLNAAQKEKYQQLKLEKNNKKEDKKSKKDKDKEKTTE
ncbi:hypothetical protein [Flavobacterium sp. XGLA_31]|uniref:hypothetical protein n=1 Tax=Flavobacterium sp. XGLA_31 TaxID=3447666 RepID=UPI003F31A4EC